MDDPTLLFLLKGGHLNVADRIARGLWPHPPLMPDAVTEVDEEMAISESTLLATWSLFCPNAEVPTPGRTIPVASRLAGTYPHSGVLVQRPEGRGPGLADL